MSFLKRLFSVIKPAPVEQISTEPLDPQALRGYISAIARRHMLVGAAYSAGMNRNQGDDSFLVFTSGADGDEGLLDFGIFCVADGSGESGHIASSIAIRTIAHDLTRDAFLSLLEDDPNEEAKPLDELIHRSFEEANTAVLTRADGGATMLTAALVLGDQMVIGHIGNTRAYSILGEKIECITCDQSLDKSINKNDAVKEGDAIREHPPGDLLNALGKTTDFKVDVASYNVMPGSRLLLCSDGLWNDVAESKIRLIATGSECPQTACDNLIATAQEAGSNDNITVVQVIFPHEET
jgi:serine/threonine protein phosphatase PrpC